MRRMTILALATTHILATTAAWAADVTHEDLTISEPWARETAASAKAGGSYMVITNGSDQPDRLIAASSPAAKRVELHTHIVDGDIMRMREVEGGIDVPPQGVVQLAPGGYHVMLMGLTEQLQQGASFPVTLIFESAGEVEVVVDIKDIAHKPKADHNMSGHGERKKHSH